MINMAAWEKFIAECPNDTDGICRFYREVLECMTNGNYVLSSFAQEALDLVERYPPDEIGKHHIAARMQEIDKRISKFLGSFSRFYKEGHTHRDINSLAIKLLEELRTLTITEEQGELELECATCVHQRDRYIDTGPCANCFSYNQWKQ